MARKQDKEPKIDLFLILKYFVLWVFFSLIAYGVKTLVMMGIHASPIQRVGNGYLTLSEVHNTGAAFNLFANQPEMIITASFMAVAVITFIVLITSAKLSSSSISAMAFLSAGITMNMLERIYQGYVTDYIHCNFIENFPVFNVPDIMIVMGAIGLVFSIFTRN